MPRPRKPARRSGYQSGKHFSPGAGAIVPIKGGERWRGAFTWHDPETGRTRRIWITGVDEADVLRRWAAKQRQLAGPEAVDPDTLTVRDYLKQWLAERILGKRRTRTFETYVEHAERITAGIGDVRLSALDRRQIQRLYGDLERRGGKRGQGLAPVTVRLTHTVLHSALRAAVKDGLLTENPADGLELPKRERHESPAISPEQLRAILHAATATGDRLAALWLLIATTGLRRSEALGVRWDDLDLERGTLTVRRQLVTTRSEGLQLSEPKSKQGRRPIRLMARTVAALRAHHRQTEAEGFRAELVFLTEQGQPYHGKTIDTHWRRLLARNGVAHVRLHDLRHTLATLLLAQGEHPRLVQELLGHSQIGITMDVYSHVLPSLHGAAMRRLEGVLWPDVAPVVARGEESG